MSALGQKQTFTHLRPNVRFTPESGHWNSAARCPLCAKSRHSAVRRGTSLFNHLVGDGKDARRNREAERSGCGEVDDKLEFG